MTIEQLRTEKDDLLKKANTLSVKVKKMYAGIDIGAPMSKEEKEMKRQLSDLFSKINTIVKEINSIKKLTCKKSQ